MSDELNPTRYEFTYRNSFNDKYSADRDIDPDGEYIEYTPEVQEAIAAWNRRAPAQEQAKPSDAEILKIAAQFIKNNTVEDGREWRAYNREVLEFARGLLAAHPPASPSPEHSGESGGNALLPAVLELDSAIHKVLIAGDDSGDDLHNTHLREILKQAQHVAYRALISIGIDRIPGAVNPLSAFLPKGEVIPAPAASSSAAPSECDPVQYLRNIVKDAAPMLRTANFGKTADLLEGAAAALAAPTGASQSALTDADIVRIRDTIKPGDGWDGDNWDFALAYAIERHLTGATPTKGAL